MPMTADQSQAQTATLINLGAIFVSLELSKSTWLVTALSPGSEKMSRSGEWCSRYGRRPHVRLYRPEDGPVIVMGSDRGSANQGAIRCPSKNEQLTKNLM